MSLQQRLTLLFVAIVMLPITVAGFWARDSVVSEVGQREESRLNPALIEVESAIATRLQAVDEFARPTTARLLRSPKPERLNPLLQRRLRATAALDFLIVLDSSEQVLAAVTTEPSFAPGFRAPTAAEIVAEDSVAGAASRRLGLALGDSRQHRASAGTDSAARSASRAGRYLVAGFWTDRDFLEQATRSDVELALLSGDRTVAVTANASRLPSLHSEGSTNVRVRTLPHGSTAVAWYPLGRLSQLAQRLLLYLLGLLGVALVVFALLSHWLSRLLTRSLKEVAEGAEAISQGRFDHRIPIRSSDDVGQLAASFNEMAARLGATVEELSSSRDLLRRTVQRVGDILRSTHDMRSILESILHTAADAVGADVGVVWGFSPRRDELYPIVVRDARADGLGRVSVGAGIVGLVAERGTIVVRHSSAQVPQPAISEPRFPVAVAIPIHSQQRIHSVLTVYRRDSSNPFEQDDVDVVKFLADQGRVALENVMLHEEAQRLSITDGLTGVWNRRFLQMQFRSMHATAIRFNRPFSLLMLDLDHFKLVNDTHGHQRGDAVLIEFAQRLSDVIREVDVVARFGGEEFVCLLSETDLSGAIVTAEKILEEIRSEPFGGGGERPLDLTASVGVASWPQHGDTFRMLVAAADRGLYRAKHEGRNRIGLPEGPPDLKVAR